VGSGTVRRLHHAMDRGEAVGARALKIGVDDTRSVLPTPITRVASAAPAVAVNMAYAIWRQLITD
jgi:hypothetical protein